jgi:NADPH:quinone reductase-like Zn-dependent oxidoreductase
MHEEGWMKALFYSEFSGYKGIQIGELPDPICGDHEVLVKIKAFSLNHLDIWVMEGKMDPQKVPMPHIFGSDAAGVVAAVGCHVTTIQPGDEVILFPGLSCGRCSACLSGMDLYCKDFSIRGVISQGVSSEYVVVQEHSVIKKPASLDFLSAAALGVSFTTAWNALVWRAKIKQGDTILIHGAGSGVGTALIQIAKLFHATVITTVGDDTKIARAELLGADFVINYRKEDFVAVVEKVTKGRLCDIVVDHVGAATFVRSTQCIRKGGAIVFLGTTTGDEITISLRSLFGRNISLYGVYLGTQQAFRECLHLVPHFLQPILDSEFLYENVHEAYATLLKRNFFGKIVIRMDFDEN